MDCGGGNTFKIRLIMLCYATLCYAYRTVFDLQILRVFSIDPVTKQFFVPIGFDKINRAMMFVIEKNSLISKRCDVSRERNTTTFVIKG